MTGMLCGETGGGGLTIAGSTAGGCSTPDAAGGVCDPVGGAITSAGVVVPATGGGAAGTTGGAVCASVASGHAIVAAMYKVMPVTLVMIVWLIGGCALPIA